jgi:spore germination protein
LNGEKDVQKQLDKQAAKLIKQLKSLGVDPLGLGAKYMLERGVQSFLIQ